MRLALFAVMMTIAPAAVARGTGGWGWLMVGAPFILALFVFFDAFADKANRRRDPYAGLPAFLLSVFLGVPIAILCAEWLAQLAGLSKEGGFWLLLGVEVLALVAYDRFIGFSQANAASSKTPEPSETNRK